MLEIYNSAVQEAGLALHPDSVKLGKYARGRNSARDLMRAVRLPVAAWSMIQLY